MQQAYQPKGVHLIAAERARQIDVEGWTLEHDRQEHYWGTIAEAAAAYVLQATSHGNLARDLWPWAARWWKPKDSLKDLIRAGALIAAAIDLLQVNSGPVPRNRRHDANNSG